MVMLSNGTLWSRAEDIFHDAVGLGPADRQRLLEQRCGADTVLREGVSFLLRGSDLAEEDFIEPPGKPGGSGGEMSGEGTRIGRYRILRPLASGGMGEVYEAEQDSPRRIVALKVLRSGLASPVLVRRFEHEAELLGRLRHPNIAQVYDAGTCDRGFGPVPFFAMELVPDASPITSYAAAHALGLRERIGLFLAVCEAVSHGHQRGVIHRDLKPGNILIDAGGAVKVIDFGVARVVDAGDGVTIQTDAGQLIGTIGYMSPEQLSADPAELDIRTDVYSLGVVLFEVLCGRLPHEVGERSVLEAARVIREEPPARPSGIRPALRGDLETILLFALEKDKNRRYQSVAQFAADLRRYLADEPVSARPATTLYQLRKLARRHRGVTAGAALALIGIVLGAAGAAWQAVQATRERDRAVLAESVARQNEARAAEEAERAKRMSRCLEAAIGALDPTAAAAAPGSDATLGGASPAAMLHASAESILRELGGRPLEQADLLDRLGRTYVQLGLMDRAREVLERSIALRERELGPEHRSLHAALSLLAKTRAVSGQEAASVELYRRILRILPRDPVPGAPAWEHPQTALERFMAAQSLCSRLTALNQLEEAEAVIRAGLEEGRQMAATYSRVPGRVLLVDVLSRRGNLAGARAECLAALAEAKVAGDIPHVALLEVMLGVVEERSGNPHLAEGLYAQARRDWETRRLPDEGTTPNTAQSIASIHQMNWRMHEASEYLRDALEGYRGALGHRTPRVAVISRMLADTLQQVDRAEEAAPLYRSALQIFRASVGDESEEVGTCLFRLVQVTFSLGDRAGLERLRTDVEDFERYVASLPESHPHHSGVLLTSGMLSLGLGELERSERLLRDCIARRQQQLGPQHKLTAYAQTILGACLVRQGRLEEADALLSAAVPIVERGYTDRSFVTREAWGRLAELRAAQATVPK